MKQRLLQAVDGTWAQSVVAGLCGLFAHLDTCAAVLAVVVLVIQIINGRHKRKILLYNERIAKMRYEQKKEYYESRDTNT